ncbi:unnamed protein product [Arabidopsis lyrata]|nr:unnamed protein product [Arabidopsis lyrata]
MGFSGAAPILHKLIIFWDQPEALHTTGAFTHYTDGLVYLKWRDIKGC